MDKIFEQAKDLHVVATYVYGNGDNYAYIDAECTKNYKTSELKEVFVKGALININGILCKPLAFSVDESSGGAAVIYINSLEIDKASALAASPDEVKE